MTTTAPQPPTVSTAFRLRRGLFRTAWMALLWLGLVGWDPSAWVVGAPVVLAAAWISVKLLPAISWWWSPLGAVRFAGYFLRESLRGGWDVARRALSPRLALAPAIVRYPLHLPPGPSRLFLCSAISLLPGTAVVAIEDQHLCVHVLDHTPRVLGELRTLEQRVAGLFGVKLTSTQEPVA